MSETFQGRKLEDLKTTTFQLHATCTIYNP